MAPPDDKPVHGEQDAPSLLKRLEDGDREASEQLFALIYSELKLLARNALSGERPNHTLTPTDLLHNTYTRMIGQTRTEWAGRGHFMGIAVKVISRLLVDYARERATLKRTPPGPRVDLDQAAQTREVSMDRLVEVNEALGKLARHHPRPASVVELKFYAGMTNPDIARWLNVSEKTVVNDWAFAKSWLGREIQG
ncbi:MAG: RNA polymerase subunit sigma [Phycisphaerales bacterium]|nr:RNA polymerase subunit sigma [Phycisphaerales bacterium]